ncbi:hypothetical protein [Actinoplanes sp. DH11]|uniref:hypothetical protein n=1 Tax=Actinoplanes sp. DH11 TaxID=2857011 RepID=UPI001E5BBEB2|nr:hypothetical protein [Actinoplanes sp. DH11]
MIKKSVAVLITTAALATACSGPSTPAPEATGQPGPPSAPVTAPPSTAPPSIAPTPTAPTEQTTTAVPTPTRPTTAPPRKIGGKDLSSCPNAGQKTQVQEQMTKDVTGDGVPDTLVARTCEASTSYIPSTVEVFDGAAGTGRPRRIGTLLKDVGPTDLPWYRSMTVDGETITIEAYGVSEGGVQACADLKLTYTYAYAGDSFRRTARNAAKVDDLCLPVG